MDVDTMGRNKDLKKEIVMQLAHTFETYAAVPAVNWSSAYGEIAESHAANDNCIAISFFQSLAFLPHYGDIYSFFLSSGSSFSAAMLLPPKPNLVNDRVGRGSKKEHRQNQRPIGA